MADEIQEEVVIKGPGEMLKARRKSLNMSIEEVAEKLHLRPAVVIQLEEDQIDHSVSLTFTKGYVRLYAKHLELDPTPILEAFDALANPVKQPAKLQSFSQKVAKQASDTRLMMFSYFVLFLIIGMAVIWWFQQPDEAINSSPPASSEASAPGKPDSQEEILSQQDSTDTSQATAISYEDGSTIANSLDGSEEERITSNTSQINSETESAQSPVGNDQIEQVSTDTLLTEQAAVGASVEELPEEILIVTEDEIETGITDPSSSSTNEEQNDIQRELLAANNAVSETSPTSPEPASPEAVNQNTVGQEPLNNAASDTPEDINTALMETETNIDPDINVEPITQELVFTFQEDCWMNLTDATGENIAYGVKKAGRVMPVSGIPPFEVVLGAPQGVQITIGGTPVDMSRFPAGRTARFTIGDTSQ